MYRVTSLEDCDSLHPIALRTAKTLWRFAVQNAIGLKELPLKNCLFMALLIQSHNLLFLMRNKNYPLSRPLMNEYLFLELNICGCVFNMPMNDA